MQACAGASSILQFAAASLGLQRPGRAQQLRDSSAQSFATLLLEGIGMPESFCWLC